MCDHVYKNDNNVARSLRFFAASYPIDSKEAGLLLEHINTKYNFSIPQNPAKSQISDEELTGLIYKMNTKLFEHWINRVPREYHSFVKHLLSLLDNDCDQRDRLIEFFFIMVGITDDFEKIDEKTNGNPETYRPILRSDKKRHSRNPFYTKYDNNKKTITKFCGALQFELFKIEHRKILSEYGQGSDYASLSAKIFHEIRQTLKSAESVEDELIGIEDLVYYDYFIGYAITDAIIEAWISFLSLREFSKLEVLYVLPPLTKVFFSEVSSVLEKLQGIYVPQLIEIIIEDIMKYLLNIPFDIDSSAYATKIQEHGEEIRQALLSIAPFFYDEVFTDYLLICASEITMKYNSDRRDTLYTELKNIVEKQYPQRSSLKMRINAVWEKLYRTDKPNTHNSPLARAFYIKEIEKDVYNDIKKTNTSSTDETEKAISDFLSTVREPFLRVDGSQFEEDISDLIYEYAKALKETMTNDTVKADLQKMNVTIDDIQKIVDDLEGEADGYIMNPKYIEDREFDSIWNSKKQIKIDSKMDVMVLYALVNACVIRLFMPDFDILAKTKENLTKQSKG